MPIYEYSCKECNHTNEYIQKVSDAPLNICPECGGHFEKLISSPAIQFKGSGFYINDYKSSSSNAGNSNNSTPKKSTPEKKDLAS